MRLTARISAPALFVLLAWLLFALPALAGPVVVDFLDVGQGDAILIRGGGKSVLIDTGDRGSSVVAQLRALDVQRLDLVVATHPHADHIGEMANVLRAFPIGLYLDNGLPHDTQTYRTVMQELEERQVPYRTARVGMTLKLGDEAVLHVLNPADTPLTGTRSDLNSNSVVLLLEHDEMRFLFTGDSEEPTERALLLRGLGDIDLLKVAHHGSAHSTTRSFLDTTRPEQAVVSVGQSNRYKHPDPGTIERLQSAGAMVYRTDLSGNLRAVSDGLGIEILEGTLIELGPNTVIVARPDLAPVLDRRPGRIAPPKLEDAIEADAATDATVEPPERRKKREKRKKKAALDGAGTSPA